MTAVRATMTLCGGVLVTAALIAHSGASTIGVREVQIVASRFMYEPSTIQVTAGQPVRLVI